MSLQNIIKIQNSKINYNITSQTNINNINQYSNKLTNNSLNSSNIISQQFKPTDKQVISISDLSNLHNKSCEIKGIIINKTKIKEVISKNSGLKQ